SWLGSSPTMTQVVPLDGRQELPLRFERVPTGPSQVLIRGLRASDERVYSAGKSFSFEPNPSGPTEVCLFLGPVDAFTPLVGEMPGPRMGARTVPLGNVGALVSGGYEQTQEGASLAKPSVVIYRACEGRVCGPEDGCVSGEVPPPRRDGIALPVADGNVL